MLADARAATALACASLAVVLADARAPTLSASASLAIVRALLVDARHLQSALCFLLILDETSQQSLLLRQDKATLCLSVKLEGVSSAQPKSRRLLALLGQAKEARLRKSPSSSTEKQRVLVG